MALSYEAVFSISDHSAVFSHQISLLGLPGEEDTLEIGSLGELVSEIPSDLIVRIPQIYLHIIVS